MIYFNSGLYRVLATLWFMITFSAICMAEVTVSADRNPVSLNESFNLTFDVSGSSGDDPDFSPLQKDFQILSTSQNSYFNMVNGQISSSKQWTLTLIPNAAGTIQIPPITFGRDTSPAVELEVTDVSSAVAGQKDEYVFLEATVSNPKPYVQAQVLYTLKLYRSVGIGKAQLIDPVVGEGTAVIERVDEDKVYDAVINGKNWQVVERTFAIYPQSSGVVKIESVTFTGQIVSNSYGYDPFGRSPSTVIRRSPEIVFDVKPIPAAFTGDDWLPASNLTIAEQWSVDPSDLQEGEPVTRTLILNATGLTASQLPELPAWTLDNLKYYPDQPALSDAKTSAGITGSRSEKAAIIPNRAGNYVLAEITIPWWNTTTDKLEYAVVPEHTIQVRAGTAGTSAPANIQQSHSPPQAVADPEMAPEVTTDVVAAAQGSYWKWISMALLAAWLTTLLAWWQRNRTPVHTASAVAGGTGRPDSAKKQVLNACKRNDPHSTRQHLLQWAQSVWPDRPPRGLADISLRTTSEMAEEIRKLNDALYSQSGNNWTGDNLARIFTSESVRVTVKEKTVRQGKLEPLHRI